MKIISEPSQKEKAPKDLTMYAQASSQQSCVVPPISTTDRSDAVKSSSDWPKDPQVQQAPDPSFTAPPSIVNSRKGYTPATPAST